MPIDAHSGRYEDPKWIFDRVISPDDHAAYAERWLARGVNIIGGCGGVRPDHIAHLGEAPVCVLKGSSEADLTPSPNRGDPAKAF